MHRAGGPATQILKGALVGFVAGCLFVGLPIWGVYALLSGVDNRGLLIAFAGFSGLIGLASWDQLVTKRSIRLHGSAYRHDLPRICSMPLFKVLSSSGFAGLVVLPFMGWKHGALWALGLDVGLIFTGTAIGYGILAVIDSMD